MADFFTKIEVLEHRIGSKKQKDLFATLLESGGLLESYSGIRNPRVLETYIQLNKPFLNELDITTT